MGLTQAQLAERIGVATITIKQYESGARSPRNEKLLALSACLGMPAQFYIGAPPYDYDDADIWAAGSVTVRPDYGKRLNAAFDKLNPDGQAEAVDRVEELTEIPKYQREPGKE